MNFLENLRNRLCCCNPRRLRAQQVAETAKDMAMNVVNRVNDNPQQEENLVPVRYEHIVGHLGANINTRPQPVAEELHEEQPVNQPAHQPGNRPVNQPINQGSSTNSQNQMSGEQRHYSVRPSSYCPGITPQEIYPINEEGIRTPGYTERMVKDYLAEHNYSQQAYEALEEARMAQLRANQPANQPVNQPAAQQNNPNPIFTVRHTLGTPGYNLENAPAMSRTFSAGTHIFTGYDPFNNQRIEIDTDLNNEDRLVFRNIPKVEISRGNQHYTFDNARVVRVKRSDSIDENDGQLHIDRNGNVRAKG